MPGSPFHRRVLVADDEPLILALVHDSLIRWGYEVELSPDGRDALNKYRAGAYSLIILDVMMDRKTGLEVVSHLRDGGDEVPIILMSALPVGAGRMEPFAFSYHVELLRKPFGLRNLRSAVERATRQVEP